MTARSTLGALARSIAGHRRRRSAAVALAALDDRLLADIGLNRAELDRGIATVSGSVLAWPAGRPILFDGA